MIIVDAGVLIAATDVDDDHHEACSRLFVERGSEFIVPATVVVEVCWMLAGHVSTAVEAEFLDSIAEGELRVEILDRVDYARASELVTIYGDFPLGHGRCLGRCHGRAPQHQRGRHPRPSPLQRCAAPTRGVTYAPALIQARSGGGCGASV